MFRAGPHQQLPDTLSHFQEHWDLLWRQMKSQVVSAKFSRAALQRTLCMLGTGRTWWLCLTCRQQLGNIWAPCGDGRMLLVEAPVRSQSTLWSCKARSWCAV